MEKTLLKYAAAVTAAKVAGAATKAAMIAAAKATMTEGELAMMLTRAMPTRCQEVEDAAWAGKTFRQQHPDKTGLKEILDRLDEALTPVP